LGGAGESAESVGKVVGLSPDKTIDRAGKGDVGGLVDDVGGVVKNGPKKVKNAPQAGKDLPKSLPKAPVKVPKAKAKLPGGTSVKTGQGDQGGTSGTVPPTQLPGVTVPGLTTPSLGGTLPENDLTSGLGL
jgi:hypothetical protein